IQTAFFDYDLDGDLDCYLTNHPGFKMEEGEFLEGIENPADNVRDKFFRNDNGYFKEISKDIGINNFGHGLGLGVSDVNNDGYPDVYIGNDFQIPDFYYINNGDGTFTESLKEYFKHTSYFSMGIDIADINNDGLLDIFVVEMLAEDNSRQKTNMAPMNPEFFWKMVDDGLHFQLMRNSLHLNNGNGSFSDIAYFSGLPHTDWSWGSLLADFDCDGNKDLVITNGYLRDMQDKDYMRKFSELRTKHGDQLKFEHIVPFIPETPIRNYAFRNNGDLTFTDITESWGFDHVGFSNGIAYGDLDNDGDLDLVINNFNDMALIYENQSANLGANFIKIGFKGPKGNRNGIGTKVKLQYRGITQYQEFHTSRGFQSSCDHFLFFGLGEATIIDKILVEWPGGSQETLIDIACKQTIHVDYNNASPVRTEKVLDEGSTIFSERQDLDLFRHQENDYDDYATEVLLPHKQSQHGPKIAVADINNDGLEDFFIGGASGQAGRLFIQSGEGFKPADQQPWVKEKEREDVGVTFFDVDNDNDLDLYISSGGNEFKEGSEQLADRLYLNEGNGKFTLAKNVLPDLRTSTGIVVAGDYDNDGDQDLFVGSRIIPANYPYPPRSYLLQNNDGIFSDVTESVAPDLMNPGLVTSAVWTDYDNDNAIDLILLGEWMPVTIFKNDKGTFKNVTHDLGLSNSTGWWNKIVAQDLDNDGDIDYVLGNLGLNYKYKASIHEPLHVYAKDFDNSGTQDIVLGWYTQGECYPVRGRQCSSEQIASIKEKFPSYNEFGNAKLSDVYGDQLADALHYQAFQFANSFLINNGGNLDLIPMPKEAQFSPIYGIAVDDFDQDGTIDVLISGNFYAAEVETGRADAGIGLLMVGKGDDRFEPITVSESGFFTSGDVKDLGLVRGTGTKYNFIIVGNNDDFIQIFQYENAPMISAIK
ncbi:MAG: VCBS repeat-containing protein, partial [Bacteroidetes bacterium]|nr:VCBS repeat-containing protein [Bacteroidota bacterium]